MARSLFVFGALAHQIAAGRVSWNQELTVTDALKSPGSGSLQDVRVRNPGERAADGGDDDRDQ
jgi:hypothetical protein